MKKRRIWKLFASLGVLLAAGIYYYIALPAVNIHSNGLWSFLLALILLLTFLSAVSKLRKGTEEKLIFKFKSVKFGLFLAVLLCVIYGVGYLLSSPIINAKKYQALIQVETRDFSKDIQEADYSKIPILDKNSATLLGTRKMGSMVDMVSQFEVSPLYTQINYQDKPVRVTPLVYASPIKWLTNQKEGIPAYIRIDMTTQNTELVKLERSIKYSQSEYFNRNIYRHLRFHYPTYIFDELSFEIDDEGTPYWICPVKEYRIGLFGGVTIGRVVLCNAQTGKMQDFAVEDCPTWVDHVYSADLLIQLYDYYGTLKNGYFNSILGQKGCLQTTDGYNYLALEDDVWVYTGITSVSGDLSNVGFVLMNQRTMECRYYEINGAEEFSAMSSAEGQVQNLGYDATFPLLLNVSGQPTYFMALKDGAGLVKKYAMVNIQKYQNVAIGDTVDGCRKNYVALLKQNGISTESQEEGKTAKGKIAKIAEGVVDGNSHYYVILEKNDLIFDVSVPDYLDIIRYNVGDSITFSYEDGEHTAIVTGIKG